MSASVCLVTAGHLSTCPRLLKAADLLDERGYRVRVVSTRYVGWATEADAALRRTRRWRWTEVDFEPGSRARLESGLRQRAARAAFALLGPDRAPLPVVERAFGRFHDELFRAAAAEPADLYYGGTSGALAATARAARVHGAPYALDLEDFHDGEFDAAAGGPASAAMVGRIEDALWQGAAFLTAGSAAVADAYAALRGRRPIPLHNTFALPPATAEGAAPEGGPLRMYWFSQTIGPRRGLEDAVRAVGLAAVPAELHLRGQPLPGYLDGLRALAARHAPSLRVVPHGTLPPDELVASCRGYHLGLSLEHTGERHRALCLTNKALTYPLVGVPVALTDTPGQRELARDLGEGAIVSTPGDAAVLGAGLRALFDGPARRRAAGAAARRAAERRWHFGHPLEGGTLLAAVEAALAPGRLDRGAGP